MLVNKQAVFKLCDFGISRHMRVSQSVAVGSVQGTEAYLPVCKEVKLFIFENILFDIIA